MRSYVLCSLSISGHIQGESQIWDENHRSFGSTNGKSVARLYYNVKNLGSMRGPMAAAVLCDTHARNTSQSSISNGIGKLFS